MTTNQALSIFISSKMQELTVERRAIQAALAQYRIYGWLWETDAGARPEPIRSTYLKEVEACDIYLGLFWLGYGPYTIEEFQHARKHHKPCLIYEKHVDIQKRDQSLTDFLQTIQRVDAPDGLTIYRFNSAEELAEQVQIDVMRLLTTIFRKDRQQPPAWNVPYLRNPLFTGRETLLNQLHDQLTTTKTAALTQRQAITGLGGIGKTQTAVEYAYRYQQDYRSILWVNASSNTLLVDYVKLAALLNLPVKDAQDQTITIAAVKNWLATHENWLLIFDNVDDLTLIEDFLPPGGKGHILLTTRAQAPGTLANSIEVEKMDKEEGMLLLLRRAKLLLLDASLEQASQQDRTAAETIVKAMDGLPLALDQAGAYIEETGCSLTSYLNRYQQQQATLLKRRGGSGKEHPEPVATTWSISFEQVEHLNPAAADLLHFFAFLAPDAIPEELIVAGASQLTPLLQPIATDPSLLDEAIAILRRFSLVRRNREDNTLSIHRLVQAILKASLSEQTQHQWTERTVRAVNQAFPDEVSVDTWPQCQRYLPHAEACADLITHYILAFPEAARLLNQAAAYLKDRALYPEAESLLQQALAIREQLLGASHPSTATSLNNLAYLYRAQGKYAQAEPLYLRALQIREQVLGAFHPDTAQSLNNLAELYRVQGRYEQAEPLHQRVLQICEQVLGPSHPNTAISLNNLALLYYVQGKYTQAEPLYQRALQIREQVLGPSHPDTAKSLNNLAELYRVQGKYEQAEPLYQRALQIYEQVLGPSHPNTAISLNNLAELYRVQGKYEQAESPSLRALAIDEKAYGPDHPDVATDLNNLALLYYTQGKYAQAEPLYRQALQIRGQVLGPSHPDTAKSLNNLALLYYTQGKYEQAEPLYQRALQIHEQVLGPSHPDTALSLNNLANLYYAHGKYAQAEPLHQRVLQIHEQVLGPSHPNTATSLNNLAYLYYAQGKYTQAEPLYQRALQIYEQALGPSHPDTAQSLNNLSALYYAQGKYEQAELLVKRALQIYEQALGVSHPTTVTIRENYTTLLKEMKRKP